MTNCSTASLSDARPLLSAPDHRTSHLFSRKGGAPSLLPLAVNYRSGILSPCFAVRENLRGIQCATRHTRMIIRDRQQAFIGSQSLRTGGLDSRRELGLIVQDAKVVKKLINIYRGKTVLSSAA